MFNIFLIHAPLASIVIGMGVLVVAIKQRDAGLRRTANMFLIAGAIVAVPAFVIGYRDELVTIGGDSINPMKLSLLVSEILGGLAASALILERLRLQYFGPSPELIVIVGMLTSLSLTFSTDFSGRADVNAAAHVTDAGSR